MWYKYCITILIDLGYYCPEGQESATPGAFPCPVGHFCVEGSANFEICPSGTYQDLTTQGDCIECPAGYYCDNSIEPISNYTKYACPQGKY